MNDKDDKDGWLLVVFLFLCAPILLPLFLVQVIWEMLSNDDNTWGGR